jgi:regulator of sigma E protease
VSLGVAILALAFLVLVHEAGHFVVARAVGMRPRKFYLGFGTPIVKTTRGGVEYGIGVLPLGGYVKIPGMHRPAPGDLRATLPAAQQAELGDRLDALDAAIEREDHAAARDVLTEIESRSGRNRVSEELEGSLALDAYWRQPAWKRVVVIAAGPATNMLVATLLFLAYFMSGSTKPTTTIQAVLGNRPAAAAGVRPGDRIVSVAGHPVRPTQIPTRINATRGRPFTLVVERNGRRVAIPVHARLDQGAYRIGVEIGYANGPGESFAPAVWSSLKLVGSITSGTASSIAGLVHGTGTHGVSSVVGITRATSQAYKQSFRDFIGIVGLVSLALALLNLLPVLPLDGGHIVMSILERVRGRAFSQLAYMRYSAVGISLFAILFYLGLRNDLFAGHS